MVALPGSGLPMLSKVLRPMISVPPIVIFLKSACSPFTRQADELTRHQLRAAVRLDDATHAALRPPRWPEERRRALLVDVIAETGAAFIEENVPFPTRDAWRGANAAAREGFLESLRARLFNAAFEPAGVGAESVGFDVRACRFVELCGALGRPSLARAFCEADSRFFARNEDLIRLERSETLARGGAVCDFRFHLVS